MCSMHVLGHRSGRDFEPKPRQFRPNPPLTPKSVLDGHAADKGPEFRRNRATARLPSAARTPAPISPPPVTVPAQHRFGFHNEQRGSPVNEPATGQNPETPVRILEAWPWLLALQDQQLLSEAPFGRTAAAIAHRRQRNIHLSPCL